MHWDREFGSPTRYLIVCQWCGAEHRHGRRDGKFCSLACRDAFKVEAGRRATEHTRQVEVWIRPADFAETQLAELTGRHRRPFGKFTSGRCRVCAEWFTSEHAVVTCGAACGDVYGRWQKREGRWRRKARERGATGSFRWEEFMGVFLAFGRCCAYCEQRIDGQPEPDHVLALSRGGSNSITNILPACRDCNGDKSDLTLLEWAGSRARRGLSPRRTSWPAGDRRVMHVTSFGDAGTPRSTKGWEMRAGTVVSGAIPPLPGTRLDLPPKLARIWLDAERLRAARDGAMPSRVG